MENTPQFKILTGHMAYFKSIDGYADCFLNPFYKVDIETVKENMEEAKNIYKYVFNEFIATWYIGYKQGNIKGIPSKEWEVFEI